MVLSPLDGRYVDIYYGSGTPNDYSNEPMQEVALAGYAAHTVYRITAEAKRILHDSQVPVFQHDTGGNGTFVTYTPTEIWFGAGYIVGPALGASDVVRCQSGKYLTPQKLFGCMSRGVTDKTAALDITCYGDQAEQRYPGLDDWDGKMDVFAAKLCAELQTIGGIANSHFILRDIAGGVPGNNKSITITQSTTLTVTVNTLDLAITLATGGNTANQVMNAINTSAAVKAIGLAAYPVPGETGAGNVAVLAHQHLNETTAGATGTPGRDHIDFKALKGQRLVMRWYSKLSDGVMDVGYGIFENLDWAGGPKDLLKCSISMSGSQYPLRRVSNA
jgi:hypothetical protein